jgi:hypothetical protein
VTLDVEVVCPACRRFWHGPPGNLPFPSPRGVLCRNEGHALARRPDPVTVVRVRDVLVDFLTSEDVEEVVDHAEAVVAFAEAEHLSDRRGYDPGGHAENVENTFNGFVAEKAVAAYLGEPWRKFVGRGAGDLPDVGEDVEVKWRSRSDWDLIVEPAKARAHREWSFVLARGVLPALYLSGWAFGWEVLEFDEDDFGLNRPPILRASAETLRFMDTLAFRRDTVLDEGISRGRTDE